MTSERQSWDRSLTGLTGGAVAAALGLLALATLIGCDGEAGGATPDAEPETLEGAMDGAADPDARAADIGPVPDLAPFETTAPDMAPDMAPEMAPDMASAPDAAPPEGACGDYTARRRALFGDLHVHTSYSFDSYGLRNPRSGPAEAYRYGRGEEVSIPPYDDDGNSTRPPIRITRPLDFTAVTDHAEFIGEVNLCTTEGSPVYATAQCINFRRTNIIEDAAGVDISFAAWGAGLVLGTGRPGFCDRRGVDCEAAEDEAWGRLQAMTEEANDADPCVFTALQAYEWTGTLRGSMNHRNVIFRSGAVPSSPITFHDADNWESLARALVAQCNDSPDIDCEALAIPHNSNFSNGVLFDPTTGAGDPFDAETAALRARMEPLVEVVQAKQESECRNGFTRYGAAVDEECAFEKRDRDMTVCAPDERPCGLGEDPATDDCAMCLVECAPGETGGGCISPLDYVRNVLKEGLVQLASLGVNPFKLGFIASTDTHNATPGNVDEAVFEGHHGFQDDETDELIGDSLAGQFSYIETPGGLAVVWAEQNTRDAIFDGLQRRETYATSGTRPIVRFYGGVDPDLCDAPDFVAAGDAQGVPMGGDVSGVVGDRMVLAVHAMRDPDSAPLQQIEIVKVWLDDEGQAHEQVFDITPEPDYSADVDLATCAQRGPGRPEICATWTDPDFDRDRPAAWYARVFENPTCRWSTWMCLREGVDCDDPDQAVEACCGDLPKTIRERAWTSPIYYEP